MPDHLSLSSTYECVGPKTGPSKLHAPSCDVTNPHWCRQSIFLFTSRVALAAAFFRVPFSAASFPRSFVSPPRRCLARVQVRRGTRWIRTERVGRGGRLVERLVCLSCQGKPCSLKPCSLVESAEPGPVLLPLRLIAPVQAPLLT